MVPVVCLQIIDALFKEDPNGACLAFYDMMKKQILMPAHMMDDGEHQQKTGRNLFAVSAASRKQTFKCAVQCLWSAAVLVFAADCCLSVHNRSRSAQ
jgi:hypothetical protein